MLDYFKIDTIPQFFRLVSNNLTTETLDQNIIFPLAQNSKIQVLENQAEINYPSIVYIGSPNSEINIYAPSVVVQQSQDSELNIGNDFSIFFNLCSGNKFNFLGGLPKFWMYSAGNDTSVSIKEAGTELMFDVQLIGADTQKYLTEFRSDFQRSEIEKFISTIFYEVEKPELYFPQGNSSNKYNLALNTHLGTRVKAFFYRINLPEMHPFDKFNNRYNYDLFNILSK